MLHRTLVCASRWHSFEQYCRNDCELSLIVKGMLEHFSYCRVKHG